MIRDCRWLRGGRRGLPISASIPLAGHAVAALLAATLSFSSLACRSAPPSREAQLERLSREVTALEQALDGQRQPAQGAVRVTLAFGAEADLDLFVTGPRHESVYFANTKSAIGGTLEADQRCGSIAPRLETVHFPAAPPGVYRVGIDFPEICNEEREETEARDWTEGVAFAVSVVHGGHGKLATSQGIIRPGEFLTIVLETEVR